MKNKKKLAGITALILILCFLAGCIIYGFYSGTIPNMINQFENEDTQEAEPDILAHEETEKDVDTPPDTDSGEAQEENEEEEPEALIDDAIMITDTYCIAGDKASFYVYESGADPYTWEYYNKKTAQWDNISGFVDASVTEELDEYYRLVSVLNVPAEEEYDGMIFRCRTGSQNEEETIPEGTLYVLPPFEALTIPEEYEASAMQLLYTNEIPVTLTYADGECMEIKGLQGLYFCYEVSSTEDISKDFNEITKTITTVSKEERSYMTMPGDNPIMLRYRDDGNTLDFKINIIGVDDTEPVIVSYEISAFEVLAQDTPEGTEITADIRATDNCTEQSALLYCFALEGEDLPLKEEFIQDSSVTIHTNTNGMYAVYVMDEAGNVAKENIELIVVDTKTPEIKEVYLEYSESGKWYESNIIHVTAEDKSTVTYQYRFDGTDSGYIQDNFYTITENGTWSISVKDAAGNVSSQDIEVSNIDHTPPTILNISQESALSAVDPNGTFSQGSAVGTGSTDDSSQPQDAEQTAVVTPIVINGIDGVDGKDGADGESVTGSTGASGKNGNSVFIRYSASADGSGMTETPDSTSKYMGTYIGKKASEDPADYTWTRYSDATISYSDGVLYITQ
ncbi:MAG: hypothetical protein LUI12_10020 [Clostridiales bacterium]|nr:hypothetical protein [Clostridiales bacterium]